MKNAPEFFPRKPYLFNRKQSNRGGFIFRLSRYCNGNRFFHSMHTCRSPNNHTPSSKKIMFLPKRAFRLRSAQSVDCNSFLGEANTRTVSLPAADLLQVVICCHNVAYLLSDFRETELATLPPFPFFLNLWGVRRSRKRNKGEGFEIY